MCRSLSPRVGPRAAAQQLDSISDLKLKRTVITDRNIAKLPVTHERPELVREKKSASTMLYGNLVIMREALLITPRNPRWFRRSGSVATREPRSGRLHRD
jgi:hypothetical protein